LRPFITDAEIETAITALEREPGGGLVVIPSGGFTTVHRAPIISAAARNNVPAVYYASDYARDGGLLSYGVEMADPYRRAAAYVDRSDRFWLWGDPVQRGHVASLNRPGGNVTGITSMSGELFGKQLGILHELLPHAFHFGVLSTSNDDVLKDAQAAVSAIGGTFEVLTASTSRDVGAIFARVADEKRVQALLVSAGPVFLARRVQLAILAARFVIPAIYPFRQEAEAGGLLSYGPNLTDRDREVGRYVGRILKGETPADLPVMRPTRFELVLNLNTAMALGITVPPTLLAIANEVIE
jgi:hypothetical protein